MFSVVMPYFERPELLRASLLAMNSLYRSTPFDVVVVDDVSREDLKPRIPTGLSFDVTVASLRLKNGINPCVPYNVGASVAKGEYLVLTSPEIVPTSDILLQAKEIVEQQTVVENLPPYILFEVFGLTDKHMNSEILSAASANQDALAFNTALTKTMNREPDFLEMGDDPQKPWSNHLGAWYQHSSLRPTDLNFLSVIPRGLYWNIGGFCERFRKGTGYDDLNFRDRVKSKSTRHRVSGLAGIHLYHEEISSRKEFDTTINTNRNVYFLSKIFGLKPTNSSHEYLTEQYPAQDK
jgi:hypothetical protein